MKQKVHIEGLGAMLFQIRPFFLTISEDLRSTYYFDAVGRFMGGFFAGRNYQRGLDHRILMKWFAEDRSKQRRFLDENEARRLIDDVWVRVQRIQHGLPHTAEFRAIHTWLAAILEWNTERLCAERERFSAIYKPVTVLPPDQYLSVVVQITEGCSWNRCTFCSLYRDRAFRIKSVQECRDHAQQIKAFLGAAIGLRKSLFLADANALIMPQQRLLEIVTVLHEEFPIGSTKADDAYVLQGLYSFLDIFGAERKTQAQYRELQAHGLRRIYIGLETGAAELFGLLNKPGSPAECIEAVQTIKAAGLDVGIILLAGAGGHTFAKQHVAHSIDAIERMQLGAGDIVYLSPLIVSEMDEYTQRMSELGVQALEYTEMLEQVQLIKGAVQTGSTKPKVALYHIGEFFY